MNDGRSTNCKVGFRSGETWAIVGTLFAAGIAIGLPLGMLWERGSLDQRVNAIRAGYAEALSAKDEAIKLCIYKATDAAEKAGQAVERVTEQAR